MRPLTLEVLDRALAQQREWRQAAHIVPMAVNLSPASLLDTRLPGEIEELLERYDTPPHQLELEITEETLMRDPKRALDVIARISELGVGFSLDDFGTGYSSLAYLTRLPLDALKVDRSFVDGLGSDRRDTAITEAIIAMSHALSLDVIAEGVETAVQAAELSRLGCGLAQGFLFSRAVPAAEITRMLQLGPEWLTKPAGSEP